jgi:STE24 endopeptidase
MSANFILILIIAFVLLEFIFGKVLDFLNAKSWDQKLPASVADLYDDEKYETAKNYAKENGNVALI